MNSQRLVPKPSSPAARTRVKLRHVNCNYSKPYPPAGLEKVWWERLKSAMGTTSSDFVNATLTQIQNASRLPDNQLSETSVNAVLAFIEGARPENEVEAALVVQAACTHAVFMAVLSRMGGGGGGGRNTALAASAVAKLGRAFAAQLEIFRKLKTGGSQFVRVEHVHVNEGAQAVIGNVTNSRTTGQER